MVFSQVVVEDPVSALTNIEGYAELICWEGEPLVHVPINLDTAETVVLILAENNSKAL
jgi:hypothetical protein